MTTRTKFLRNSTKTTKKIFKLVKSIHKYIHTILKVEFYLLSNNERVNGPRLFNKMNCSIKIERWLFCWMSHKHDIRRNQKHQRVTSINKTLVY